MEDICWEFNVDHAIKKELGLGFMFGKKADVKGTPDNSGHKILWQVSYCSVGNIVGWGVFICLVA